MISNTRPYNTSSALSHRLVCWWWSVNPLTGINWSEVRNAYRVFINDPSQGILHILAAQQHSNWQKWVIARLACQAQPLKDAEIEINVPELLKLPEYTLGGAYARHLVSQGFNPEAFRNSDRDREHWVNIRAALSHDIYHVITGFDGTPVGEFGLAVFVLIQYRDLLNVFVLSHVPYFMMGYVTQIPKLLKALGKGFGMGLRSKPIFAYPFEANWQKSLTDVRCELGIHRSNSNHR